jgi:hypothetical protein
MDFAGKTFVFDSDVFIHFLKANKLLELGKIYPNNQKIILDIVTSELRRRHSTNQALQQVLTFKILEEIKFPNESQMIKEYARLQKMSPAVGKGEAACLAYCKYTSNVVASSNLKDIEKYCSDNSISYLTTMDLICQAHSQNLWTEADCDYFIYEVKSKGSKLPVDNLNEFFERKEKLLK